MNAITGYPGRLVERRRQQLVSDHIQQKYGQPWWEGDKESDEPLNEGAERVYERIVTMLEENGHEEEAQAIVKDEESAAVVLLPALEREALRAHLIATNPDAVAELIAGETIGALLGSVDAAKKRYEEIAGKVKAGIVVPAGGAHNGAQGRGARPVDVSKLSPQQKIAQGLKERG